MFAPPVIDGLTGDQRFFYGWAQVWQSKYREDALKNQIATEARPEYRERIAERQRFGGGLEAPRQAGRVDRGERHHQEHQEADAEDHQGQEGSDGGQHRGQYRQSDLAHAAEALLPGHAVEVLPPGAGLAPAPASHGETVLAVGEAAAAATSERGATISGYAPEEPAEAPTTSDR